MDSYQMQPKASQRGITQGTLPLLYTVAKLILTSQIGIFPFSSLVLFIFCIFDYFYEEQKSVFYWFFWTGVAEFKFYVIFFDMPLKCMYILNVFRVGFLFIMYFFFCSWRLEKYYSGLGDQEYRIELFKLTQLKEDLPDWDVVLSYKDFIRSDHLRFWYFNDNTSLPMSTIPAILVTDMGLFSAVVVTVAPILLLVPTAIALPWNVCECYLPLRAWMKCILPLSLRVIFLLNFLLSHRANRNNK